MLRIVLHGVEVTYRSIEVRTLKGLLFELLSPNHSNGSRSVIALRDIDLEIRQGERVGLIGRNGAGKTTLLKVMGGLLPPSKGRVRCSGKIASLFETTSGFERSVSGWTNIYLRGLFLGIGPQDIRAKMEEIAEFSELGGHLDLPLRCYSSGMLARLGFSVSTAFPFELLLLDEFLATGDEAFRAKALERMHQFIDGASTVVMSSHNLNIVSEVCNRAIWLDQGRIVQDGDPAQVIERYRKRKSPLRT